MEYALLNGSSRGDSLSSVIVCGESKSMEEKLAILAVDRDEASLGLIDRALGGEYKVLKARSTGEALDILRSSDESLYLLISDRVVGTETLPGLFEDAFGMRPDLLFIMVSASADFAGIQWAINNLRLFRYLVKPFSQDEIQLHVKKARERWEHDRMLRMSTNLIQQVHDELQRICSVLNHLVELVGGQFEQAKTEQAKTAAVIAGDSGSDQPTGQMAEKSRKSILVVDDEPLNLESLERTLEDDYEVLTAESGEKALEVLRQRGKPVDMVLTDQRMPGMSGVHLLERVLAEHFNTRRVLLTGYTEMTDVLGAINRAEADRYLVKPWLPDKMLAEVQEILASRKTENVPRDLPDVLKEIQRKLVEVCGKLGGQLGEGNE